VAVVQCGARLVDERQCGEPRDPVIGRHVGIDVPAQCFRVGFPDGPRVAADIARFGIERYGDGARPWPCGAAGPTPALMVGLAGTGYFYLRLANPALPSVLLLRPTDAGTVVEPSAVPAVQSAASHA